MSIGDWIVLAVILAIVGGAAWYIYRAKKRGAKCIGCPHASTCSGNCAGCGGNCPHKKP